MNEYNNKNRCYFCYNPLKKQFLKKEGLWYQFTGINIKTNKRYWVYLREEKLDNVLKKWKLYQEQRFNNTKINN